MKKFWRHDIFWSEGDTEKYLCFTRQALFFTGVAILAVGAFFAVL